MEKNHLESILEKQKVQTYLTTIKPGQTLCNEGDFSQDLCILVSGRLKVFRGNQKMQEITEPGAVLGKISFVLGTKRTATIRAIDEARVLLIPQKDVADFLKEYPEIAWQGGTNSFLEQGCRRPFRTRLGRHVSKASRNPLRRHGALHHLATQVREKSGLTI
ncbi:MAG: hypothetical protein B1H13_09070 [Desulfobacteraceae bacterium 4484_190.3]|nr:MAG: hypothetical protein B1H13_09070 [Desulfobacteraceae bacterium 4484_190.3]